MKKKVLMVLGKVFAVGIILTCSTSANAQDYVRTTEPATSTFASSDKKFSFSFSVGPAIPMGDFARDSVHNSFWNYLPAVYGRLQGFAKTGFHFDFACTYLVKDFWGVSVMVGDNVNTFDVNAFSSYIGYPATASSLSYSTGEYLIGPVFSLDLSQKFKARFSALAGIAKNDYPDINFTYNDTTFFDVKINDGSLSFAYCAKADLTYRINDNTDLLLGLSYLGAVLHYQGYTVNPQINSTNPNYIYITQPSIFNFSAYMNIGILKPYIGIAFKL